MFTEFKLPVAGGTPRRTTVADLEQGINETFGDFDQRISALTVGAAVSYPGYDSTAAGLAGTSDGEGFSVFGGGLLTLYRNNAGAALELGRMRLTDSVTPEHFGAAGNGVTDDTAAINAAFAFGLPVDGEGKTYGVTGKISLAEGAAIRDLALKQLAPGASASVITLEADGVSNLDLRRVKVDRNGDGTNGGFATGTNGALSTAFGMRIVGGTGHHFEDLEVWGDDSGTGILFRSLDGTTKVIRPHVHDMNFNRAGVTDDNAQGIWFDNCTDLTVVQPRVASMTNNGVKRYTRGIIMGGGLRVVLLEPYAKDVDQGIDLTGSVGNRDCRVVRPRVIQTGTWGVKLANSAVRCIVSEGYAYRCGYAGFVASGPSQAGLTYKTEGNKFIDCVSEDSGYQSPGGATIAGFRNMQSATEPNWARGTKFIRCVARDSQAVKTMSYGFHNEQAAQSGHLIECIECDVEGAVTSEYFNIHTPRCEARRLTNLTVANNTFTVVDWDAETDLGGMHDNATNPSRITVTKAGYYVADVSAFWAGGAGIGGVRDIRVYVNGATFATANMRASESADDRHRAVFDLGRLKVGDYVEAGIRHTRGSALDLRFDGSSFTLNMVRP